MIKRTGILFFLAVILLFSISSSASDVALDKATIYQRAMLLYKHGDYQKAADEFSQIAGYSDSGSWKYYCLGMAEIDNANGYEKSGHLNQADECIVRALRYFEALANSEFENSAKLKEYCSARRYQLKGLKQSALDLYAGLLSVLDSGDRYWAIINDNPLPTQAPVHDVPPVLPLIPAHASRRTPTYLGPGDQYAEQTYVSVGAEMAVGICGREDGYYLIEIETAAGRLRAWAPTIRIRRDADQMETQLSGNTKSARLSAATEPRLGPGEEYISSGMSLKEGTPVTVFGSEGLYTMIEYKGSAAEKPVRVWVPTSQLYIQN